MVVRIDSVMETFRFIPATAVSARSKQVSDVAISRLQQGDVEISTTMSAFADL